jgi:hypothetical protein
MAPQPAARAIAKANPAPYSAGLPPCVDRNGALIFSTWMRPSWTASMVLAISRILRGLFGISERSVGGVFHLSLSSPC